MGLRSAILALCLAPACTALPAAPRGAPPGAFAAPPAGAQDEEIPREYIEFPNMRWAFEAGQRRYDHGGWGEVDSMPVIGFSAVKEPPDWILGLDAGVYWAGGDGELDSTADADVDVWEGFAGVVKTLDLARDRLVLELGLGYSMTYVDVDVDDDLSTWGSDDAWWSSGYARAQLILRLGDDAWIGLAGRSALGGRADLAGADLDGDYDQFAFVLAAKW